jgi:hypothetical protein
MEPSPAGLPEGELSMSLLHDLPEPPRQLLLRALRRPIDAAGVAAMFPDQDQRDRWLETLTNRGWLRHEANGSWRTVIGRRLF